MVGTTLREIRYRIERLASDDGEYYVVCARSGDRPVPVAGERFATRTAAAEAARATEQYRAALRQYDPRLPFYDPVVCQARPPEAAPVDEQRPEPEPKPESVAASSERLPDHRTWDDHPLISFCHDVAGAVFEALSERNHATVEEEIMETYLLAAETVTDRNTLCLVLLESMATELERRLDADERMRLLRAAAANLSPVGPSSDPVESSLAYLDSLSLVREYGISRYPVDDTDDAWLVYLRGYAIDCGNRRFPTLPIGIDILRRTAEPASSFGVTEATALGDGDWQFVVTTDEDATGGLICTRGEAV